MAEKGLVADDDHPSSYSKTWMENELLDGAPIVAVPGEDVKSDLISR